MSNPRDECSVSCCSAIPCSVLQCAAVCCSVLQCAAVCCSVLQCAAMCCSELQHAAVCHIRKPQDHDAPASKSRSLWPGTTVYPQPKQRSKCCTAHHSQDSVLQKSVLQKSVRSTVLVQSEFRSELTLKKLNQGHLPGTGVTLVDSAFLRLFCVCFVHLLHSARP